jgi:cell division protein YceG involved in septum cleavage
MALRFLFSKRAIGLIILALFCFYFFYQIFSPQFSDYTKKIKISKGDNFLEIAGNLKKEGLIKSKAVFIVLEVVRFKFFGLKAGQYTFIPSSSLWRIARKIEKGESILGENEFFLSIIEGMDISVA